VVFNEFLERNKIKGIFQGLRWDEHPARFNDEYFENKDGGYLMPEHTRIRPIPISLKKTSGIPMQPSTFPIVNFMSKVTVP